MPARCTTVRGFGEGRHASTWQCTLVDPHPLGPDQPHDFGVDAEVYGRPLDAQRPEWLAAHLRDREAQLRHARRQLDELTAVAAQLARWAAFGTPVSLDVSRWLAANAPTAAAKIGATP